MRWFTFSPSLSVLFFLLGRKLHNFTDWMEKVFTFWHLAFGLHRKSLWARLFFWREIVVSQINFCTTVWPSYNNSGPLWGQACSFLTHQCDIPAVCLLKKHVLWYVGLLPGLFLIMFCPILYPNSSDVRQHLRKRQCHYSKAVFGNCSIPLSYAESQRVQ